MRVKGLCKTVATKALVMLLAVALVFTMMPLNRGFQAHAADQLTVKSPALVVTGTGLIGNGGVYSADNVSAEKSYTVDELKGLTETQGKVTKQKYSAKKSQQPYAKNYYLVDGVKISSLLGKAESDITDDVKVIATDGYATQFLQEQTYTNNGKAKTVGLNKARYFYDFTTGEKGYQVPAVIGWADVNTGLTDGSAPAALPEGNTSDLGYLRLYCGQYDGEGGRIEDMNQPLWNGKDASCQVNKVQEGDAIDEVVLTVGNKTYTRADILLMDFAERTYTYQTSSGNRTDDVRGVPFSVLLAGEEDDAEVSFTAADGYDMSSSTKTVKALVDGNFMLGYEVNGQGIYKTAEKDTSKYGFLTLYGDDAKPASMINSVSVKTSSGIDFSKSPYKHITNGGIAGQSGPYNIDSITGATLTIEGPGMTASTPLSVKDLENKNAGCYRGVYSDTRDGETATRTYEGVDLYYILTGLEKSGIKMTDKAKKVTIKNRNRKAIAVLSLADVKDMHDAGKPAIVSYGTAAEDGNNTRPFVFNDATGEDNKLGNGDGCLKFVYDLETYGNQNGKYTKFGNMAYIYVEEESAPGFKHDKAPYNKAENSQYVLTVTGDELGCEVNYTVQELEDMVQYDADGKVVDNGYGYRDEYSLANSSYWYVNSYEGVKLWSLLQHSGVDKSKANDDKTKVTFRSTDNYTAFDTFTLAEVADPDKFGFYEKNAADANDGTYKPNENIRVGDDVTTGDKLAVGYPVLVSYGANEYPYVISKDLDGFLSGLSNDGGPLRVISGKRDYSHANGSNQAKLLDKIVVGDNNYNYSTHSYQPEGSAYKALANSGLKVTVTAGGKTTSKDYTVKDIEELIYGDKLTKTQKAEAKVKSFYEVGKNDSFYSDLYEGINLNFFLTDIVELAGEWGTVTFKSNVSDSVVMSLEDVLAVKNGYNAETKLGGLKPVLAYSKNGYPLVKDKNSDGWVKNQTLEGVADGEADTKHTVQNNGGPLQLVFPRANAEATDTMGNLAGITEIEINLEADKYAHISEPYSTYAGSKLTVQGEGTRLTAPKEFTVADLEGKQSLTTTKDYSFRNKSGSVSQTRYRGLNLYNFLKSTNVGLKSNADKVLIYADGVDKPYEFTLSDIRAAYKNTKTSEADLPVILAYGSASVENTDVKDGKPLVDSSSSEGYEAAYSNDGGPLKLVIGQANEEDVNKSKCVKNVTKIEVTASEQVSWNHSSAEVYKSYLNNEVAFKVVDSDNNEIASKTYKVSELEAMTDIISQEDIFAVQQNTWEGLNFWQLIQKTFSDVQGIEDPITITVTSKDNFSADAVEKVGLDGLKNGVKDGDNYVPVILAYAVDGYPLASGGKGAGTVMGEGYDSAIDNKGGPLRLMVQNAQGACIMEVISVTIKVGEAVPQEAADFTVASNTFDKDKAFSIGQLKALTQTEKEYTVKDTTEKVRGVMLKDLLESLGITHKDASFKIEAGGYGGEGTYSGITLKDAIDQDYILAYEEFVGGEWKEIDDTKVRIYRNYLAANPEADQSKWYDKCQYISGITVSVPEKTVFDTFKGTSAEGELPLAGIRCVSFDKDGNMWVGTYGGGLAYKAKGSDKFKVYNTASELALLSAVVSAVHADSKGGVWFSQNGSYSDGNKNYGLGYMKDGQITYYRESDNPATIPNDYVQEIQEDKNGNIWIGSFGGLTKFDPAANTWRTWDKKDGFPAESVDNIELDKKGGIWCGFYPDTEDASGSKPFTGGFAYFKDDKVVKSYQFTSDQDSNTSNYRLGDVWIRDIAVDKNGGAWVVASGSYGGMKNTGGVVWYVSEPGGEAVRYTGFDLFGEDAFSQDSELRMVTVDADGGLWFGTSKDGVFRISDPTTVEGKMTISDKCSAATGSWPTGFDNVYSLDFLDSKLIVGSANGLATHNFEFAGGDEEPSADPIGDADAETADLTVTGDALARDGFFTIKGIKAYDGINKLDATFHTLNSSGTEADVTVQGATLENIVNIVGIAKDAEIDSVTIISKDGRETKYTAKQALTKDIQDNKAMFIWTENGSKVTKVCRGQMTADDVNRSSWAKDVVKIVFNKKTDSEAVKDVAAAIDKLPAADKITVKDLDAFVEAKKAYNELSDSEKASVTNYEKLKKVEEALTTAIKEATIEKTDEAIDKIEYSDYSADNAVYLWLKTNRLQSKIKNAKGIDEIATLYKEFNDLIESMPTKAEEMQEALNDYPVEVTVTPATKVIDLKWNSIPKAEAYVIKKSDAAEGVYETVKTVTDTSYTDKNVDVERAYFYKIVPAVKVNGEFVYGNESNAFSAKLPLAKPVIKSAKAGKKKATITWSQAYGAEGYVIYRSTKKNSGFKAVKTVKKASTVKYVNNKLKGKKFYYYKVKAYKKVSGKTVYSSLSKVKSVKTKK